MTGANKVDEANHGNPPGIVGVDRLVRPALYEYRVNATWTNYSKTEPSDDAYDEGTLQPFYDRTTLKAERERWRALVQRIAADANRYGREGLAMRCVVNEAGDLISWQSVHDGRRNRCAPLLKRLEEIAGGVRLYGAPDPELLARRIEQVCVELRA